MMIENKKERSGLKEHAIVNHFCVPFVDVKHVVNIKLLITACSGNERNLFSRNSLGNHETCDWPVFIVPRREKASLFLFSFRRYAIEGDAKPYYLNGAVCRCDLAAQFSDVFI